MECNKLPGNYYLFGNDVVGSKKYDSYMSKKASKIWREPVIDGLGINKKMYALRHTAGQYLVNNNDGLDEHLIRSLMGHYSLQQTEIYLQKKVVKKFNPETDILE